MARLPDGTLMQRAAAGLATAVIDLLGGAYGAPGPAAGRAGRQRRRRAVRRCDAGPPRSRGRGAAGRRPRATRRAWPRSGPPGAASSSRSTTVPPDVVVDGIVGIGGRPGLRQPALDAVRAVAGVPDGRGRHARGVDVDTGRLDGAHVTADVTVTFGTHKVCHLVEPAASACGVVQLVDLGLDLPEAAVTALQADDVAALLPRPDAVRAEVHARRRRRPRRLGPLPRGRRAVDRPARRAAWPAWCGTPVGHPTRSAPGTRRSSSARGGSRPGWSAPAATPSAAEALTAALADDVPLVVDADALQHLPARLDGARTAHAPRRRARRDARRRARRGRGRPARLRPPRGAGVRRHGAAQGPPHARRRARRTGPGHHHRYAVARRRRRRRRARRALRRPARGRPLAVRRGGGRLLAARRRGHPRLRAAARSPPRTSPPPCPG